MLQTIYSDTQFDVLLLYFCELGGIPYQDVLLKILTFLDWMAVFILEADSGLKEIILEQVSRCSFGNLFVPFKIPKIIIVSEYEPFDGMFK